MAHILTLPGDGIGAEVVAEALKILDAVRSKFDLELDWEEGLVGGASIDKHGVPLTDEVLDKAKRADSILLGAVGGPKWEGLDFSIRPERALLALRKELELFANLRPAIVYPALAGASTLKQDVISGVDILVIRELTGGIYFGEPRGVTKVNGVETGVNTLIYSRPEIERIARVAFEAARTRRKDVVSIDKANVLESTELWRNVVTEVHADYTDCTLRHMYVDNAAMQIIREPKQFDVMVTGNMFGDILSDEASMLTGSLGMLPSASIGKGKCGMYETVHGSAPDIAGQNKANPLATIQSVAMMLIHSLEAPEAAKAIENAVDSVLEQGYRTADIMPTDGDNSGDLKPVGTVEMGAAVLEALATQ